MNERWGIVNVAAASGGKVKGAEVMGHVLAATPHAREAQHV